jgi:predicted Zn-dependent protease
MTKLQTIVLVLACLLFCGVYFGTNTNPESQKKVEQERARSATSTSIEVLIKEARLSLSRDTAALIMGLEQELSKSSIDSLKVESLKRLAGLWYDAGHAAVSGHYAEEVANILDTEEAWSIAGTTYMIGGRQASEEKIKRFSYSKAIISLENAVSLDPSDYSNKVNLALNYIEYPQLAGPMKGIMMLREYNEQAPDNVLVLNTLARLAVQTNQFERAIERLTKVISLEPKNKQANCLLVKAYDGLGNKEKAAEYAAKCIDGQ